MPQEKRPEARPGSIEPSQVVELTESDLDAAVGGTDSLHLLAQVNHLMADGAGGIDKPPPPSKPPVPPKTRPR